MNREDLTHPVRGSNTIDANNRWDTFVKWARRWYDLDEFEGWERSYKLEIIARVKVAKEAFVEGRDEWGELLNRAFKYRNNLTAWQIHNSFVKWVEEHPEQAKDALEHVWTPTHEGLKERVDGFLASVPKGTMGGSSSQLSIASFLLMAEGDGTSYPIYRQNRIQKGYELAGYEPESGINGGDIYIEALAFFDKFIAEAKFRDLGIQDRLDAQSLTFTLTGGNQPPIEWSREERRSFLEWNGQGFNLIWEVEREVSAVETFNPENIEDERQRILSSIVSRRGQAKFRSNLLKLYGSKCAITGCDVPNALEAAHISPYKGEATNTLPNGLLLRADIHTLFDLGLIVIDPDTMTVVLAPEISEGYYGGLQGKAIFVPDESPPSRDALKEHRSKAGF